MKTIQKEDIKRMFHDLDGQGVPVVKLREVLREFQDELIARERISRQDYNNARDAKKSTKQEIQAEMIMAISFIGDRLKKRFGEVLK